MEIKGKIIHALTEVSGTSKAGNLWKKKEYVLENTDGQFPRKVAFTCFGDNADKINLQVGQTATIYFDIESREWNGKWFTDIRCWRADVEPEGAAAPAPAATAPGAVPPPPPAPVGGDDEFPF
ncbi:MAG: DUF3127 domain-containing protein [Muribaculaceae bacterium]|nr:DUF3127 domain-containing protein [Muribaculaceae bacterium]